MSSYCLSAQWACEFFEVAPGLFGFAAADEVAELEDNRGADRVEHRVAIAAAGDEAGVVEELQVPGDVGLIAVEGFDEFADGVFAFLELLQDAESERFAEDAETAGDDVEGRFGHGRGIHDRMTILLYSNIVK